MKTHVSLLKTILFLTLVLVGCQGSSDKETPPVELPQELFRDGVCNSDPAGNRRLFRTAVPVLWRGQRGQSRGFRKRTDTVYSGACRRHFALHPAGLPVV